MKQYIPPMKKIIATISCFLILGIIQKTFADYDKIELKLKITFIDGKTIDLFTSFPGYFELDSINSSAYLEQVLKQGYIIDEGFFRGMENRYECGGMYVYFKSLKIALNTIKSYEIVEVSNGSYLSQIVTDIELRDTSWFTKDPTEKIDFTGSEFEYTFFIYKRNKKLDRSIAEFKSEYQKTFKETDISYYEYFQDLIKKMKGKVIVSSFGSGC